MIADQYDLLGIINQGKVNNYNIKDCSMLTQIGSSVLTVGGCVFDKYIDFIKAECVQIKLTSEEQQKYRYQPKKLSVDLYQTEELWFLILKLNNMSSEINFLPKKLYILKPNKLSVINKILLLNEDEIYKNHIEISMG